MAVSKDDQNTFIMIIGVLIICIIALFAVLSSIWQIIREPVGQTISALSNIIRLQTLDYNFKIPDGNIAIVTTPNPAPTPSNEQVDQPTVIDPVYDYNFSIPGIIPGTTPQAGNGDPILSDSNLLDLESKGQEVVQGNLRIQIPKIKVDSPIVQGLDGEELLKEGFWVIPSKRKLGSSEIIFLCHRRYFGPNDPKSCWFLDQVTKNDNISIIIDGVSLNYKVVGINTFKAEDPLIYQASESEDLIKIVTTDPLYSNENRLVILAERVI